MLLFPLGLLILTGPGGEKGSDLSINNEIGSSKWRKSGEFLGSVVVSMG